MVKNPPTNTGDIRDMGLIPGLGRSKAWQPTPVFLAGESHGQRSLARYSPWGHKESDTHTHTHTHTHTVTASRFKIPALVISAFCFH